MIYLLPEQNTCLLYSSQQTTDKIDDPSPFHMSPSLICYANSEQQYAGHR